ncbi:MAG: T9SS type A sorting domain-containing protein [Candidatus Krumholzibacteriota bacterium]|nr:T9SS type A sorting domain-containing protein [Candidatus Krumholzibacteriota bacterium]
MKQIILSIVIFLAFASPAWPHEGMLALFTDMDRTSRDENVELYTIQDIYLFYIRDNGPEQINAYEFRFLVSSPDVLIMNPEWPPNTMAFGDVTVDVSVAGTVDLCEEWGSADYFYLGTIPVINYGDPDTFTISIVPPADPASNFAVCLCDPSHSIHPVIGDFFLFNGDYIPPCVIGAEASSENSIEITFDRELSPASAHNLANYNIYNDMLPESALGVTGVSLGEGNSMVEVSLEEQLVWNEDYVVEAGGIKDVNGFTILNDTEGSSLVFTAQEVTATLLLGYEIEDRGESIVISWELSEIDEGALFHLLRSENSSPVFSLLPSQDLSREGMKFRYEDTSCQAGEKYRYRIVVDNDATRKILFETEEISLPELQISLDQNYPNPFNPATSISFTLPRGGKADLSVYSVEGKLIATLLDRVCVKGENTVVWNGSDRKGNLVPSGVYFYRLSAGKKVLTRKMVLLR